jgi:hypothetical protein
MSVVNFGFEGIPGVNVEVDSEGKAEDSEEEVEPKHVLRTEDGTPGPKALLLELGVCVIGIGKYYGSASQITTRDRFGSALSCC